jgi:hypothetical protein
MDTQPQLLGGRPMQEKRFGIATLQAPPRKMVEYEHRHKTKRKGRSSGCGLQYGDAENDLLAIRLKSSMTLFSAARTSNSRCLLVLVI